MKKLISFIIILAVLSPGLGFAGKKKYHEKIKFPKLNKPVLPEILRETTANGIKLRLIKDERLPIVRLTIRIKGGSVYNPADKVGLANITAQLLRIGGTEKNEPAEIDRLLDTKGININILANTDYFTVNLSCLNKNFEEAISLLAEMLTKPAFNKEKFEEIKTRMGSAIVRRNDQPQNINQREFNKLIYGEKSPFAAVLEYEHLDNTAIVDLKSIHQRYFSPDNLLVGVVGPLDIQELKVIFEIYFSDWNNKCLIPPYPIVKPAQCDFKVAFAEKASLNQSYFSIGHLGVKFNLKNQAKYWIFNAIFSQGFTSRLMTRVRVNMGLTYSITGGILTEYLHPGKTFFTTFTKMKSTIKAINAIYEEIGTIRKEKVTLKELKDAKDYFLNSQVFDYSTSDKIINNELNREFYNLPEGYMEKLMEEIKKVTTDDVLEVAQEYLNPEKMVIFIVGKEKDIVGKLSGLGKVKKIDISIKPPALKEKIPEPTQETLIKGSEIIKILANKKYKGYKQLRSFEMEADMKMSMMGREMQLGIKSIISYPDKIHTEISMMGMKMIRIVNGHKGIFNQMGQKKVLSKEEIEKDKFADLYDIFNSREKYNFQYLKKIEIEGKKYDVVYIFDSKKNWVKFFINQETGLIERAEKLSRLPGQTGIATEIKSGFKTVNGIPFPYKSETFIKDKKVAEINVKQINVNFKVDPSIFSIDQ